MKDIGVVKMRDTVGGEPKEIKAAMGRRLITGITEEQLVPVFSTLIYFYKEQAKGKEKFSKFVDRITIEQLKQIIA